MSNLGIIFAILFAALFVGGNTASPVVVILWLILFIGAIVCGAIGV